jgi:acetoin utilization protein AcuB
MLVKQRMNANPITISASTPVAEALSFMHQNRIRRLPVLDHKGRMVGIVSEKDLLYASPSPATSLNVYEIGYLLSKLKVAEIMTQELVTVDADASLEEAARIMIDNQVGGLPVTQDGELVGIITETDIFKTLLEMMGAREHGIRLTIRLRNEPGTLNTLTGAIAELGGDILALGTFYGEDRSEGVLTLRVKGVGQDELQRAMAELEVPILDLRSA